MDTRFDNSSTIKDTTRNIIESDELVINLVDRQMATAMAACAADLDPDQSELDFAQLTQAPSQIVKPPGIEEAPIRFECRLFEMRRITPLRHLCIAEILALHARSGLIDAATLRVDPSAYLPVGRMHGTEYCETQDRFHITVPQTVRGPLAERKDRRRQT